MAARGRSSRGHADRDVRLDSRHIEDIKTNPVPVSAGGPNEMTVLNRSSRPMGVSGARSRARAYKASFMTAIARMIASSETAITGECPGGRIGTASGLPRSDYLRGKKFRLLAYAALLAAGICAAAAQEAEVARPSEPLAFHIPAQPLAMALQAYGQRAGVQVLYESNSALGRMSVAVEGDFAPEAALNMLLAGTDLKVRYVRPDVITLAPPYEDNAAAPPLSGPLDKPDLYLGTLRVHGAGDGDETAQLNEYNERVQLDIQNALRKNAKTRDGSYRAVLDLWIDPTRTIARTELFRSTGDSERDAAIAMTLRGVTISKPTPANLTQPVRVAIMVRSLQ